MVAFYVVSEVHLLVQKLTYVILGMLEKFVAMEGGRAHEQKFPGLVHILQKYILPITTNVKINCESLIRQEF